MSSPHTASQIEEFKLYANRIEHNTLKSARRSHFPPGAELIEYQQNGITFKLLAPKAMAAARKLLPIVPVEPAPPIRMTAEEQIAKWASDNMDLAILRQRADIAKAEAETNGWKRKAQYTEDLPFYRNRNRGGHGRGGRGRGGRGRGGFGQPFAAGPGLVFGPLLGETGGPKKKAKFNQWRGNQDVELLTEEECNAMMAEVAAAKLAKGVDALKIGTDAAETNTAPPAVVPNATTAGPSTGTQDDVSDGDITMDGNGEPALPFVETTDIPTGSTA
ncbi:hypothetical protein C8R46DRAFT_1059037 [Mycena filopes]|nr:hypothetical protein C8R46DRAFT_1059037 [Mycena filopes]